MNDARQLLVRKLSLNHFSAPFGQRNSSTVIINQADTLLRQIVSIHCHQQRIIGVVDILRNCDWAGKKQLQR
jgi:hypothetical protein